ncbi:MAG: glycosyltransferase family 1 protein [Bacteroidetes bacterium]|nr:MAG: glycosyltransferase family 1 protein [Bacteroidota bacterium]
MKIAVNTRLLLPGKLEGIGWVAYETLKRITTAHPEHEFYFIFDRKWDERFIFSDNVIPMVAGPQARHPLLYYIWFEWSIPRILKKIRADLFLSPDAYLSLKTDVPSIPVFHDLNFEHYPKDVPVLERKYYRYFFPRYARKASRIVTVSEFSKKDIVNLYDIPPEKVNVVYNGANEDFMPVNDVVKEETRKTLSGGCPYFIFVGALHPRKNLARLFQAFDYFKEAQKTDIKLLVVGNKKYWTGEIRNAYEGMKNKEEVIFSGRMAAEDLHKAVASALAMTYVSYFEGFGIPIIEAYRCDTPVVTSNVTSMPEVAGDAAVLVDPFSVKSIADGLEKVALDPELRATMIEKGRARSKLFTWQNSADNLWSVIDSVLTQSK